MGEAIADFFQIFGGRGSGWQCGGMECVDSFADFREEAEVVIAGVADGFHFEDVDLEGDGTWVGEALEEEFSDAVPVGA